MKNKLNVKVKMLTDTATIPTYGTEESACADLYADIPDAKITIYPHQTVKINTGLSMQPPDGYCALIYARSGLATKEGLAPANKVPVIDWDYRGEWLIPLHNHSNEPRIVNHGDRIAQVMFVPYVQADFEVCDKLDETGRGDGGFGHTGK